MLSYLVLIVFDVIFVLVAAFGYEFIPFIDVDAFYPNAARTTNIKSKTIRTR